MGFMLLCGCSKVPENTVYSLEDLKGKKIGVQLKTTGDVYASEIEGAQVQRFNKGKDAIVALQAGEIDAVMLDDGPANVFAGEFENVRILEESYAEEEYGLVVKKGNEELLDKINDALDKIEADGTLEAITKNWIYDGASESLYQGEDKVSHANGKLVVVTNAEFPPYESIVGEEVAGFDIDLMKAVCDVLDMELEIENIAFDSILSAVDRGIADVGAAAMSVTDERLKQVDFSKTYTTAKQVILVRDNGK
ncbi:MAG: transporter substrate-binding domain-containing protein [Lachnospiraceae bacterium]|nr:transporter substrate-binding domain-containing protein [Lachnospiraceae bacterium]